MSEVTDVTAVTVSVLGQLPLPTGNVGLPTAALEEEALGPTGLARKGYELGLEMHTELAPKRGPRAAPPGLSSYDQT